MNKNFYVVSIYEKRKWKVVFRKVLISYEKENVRKMKEDFDFDFEKEYIEIKVFNRIEYKEFLKNNEVKFEIEILN